MCSVEGSMGLRRFLKLKVGNRIRHRFSGVEYTIEEIIRPGTLLLHTDKEGEPEYSETSCCGYWEKIEK